MVRNLKTCLWVAYVWASVTVCWGQPTATTQPAFGVGTGVNRDAAYAEIYWTNAALFCRASSSDVQGLFPLIPSSSLGSGSITTYSISYSRGHAVPLYEFDTYWIGTFPFAMLRISSGPPPVGSIVAGPYYSQVVIEKEDPERIWVEAFESWVYESGRGFHENFTSPLPYVQFAAQDAAYGSLHVAFQANTGTAGLGNGYIRVFNLRLDEPPSTQPGDDEPTTQPGTTTAPSFPNVQIAIEAMALGAMEEAIEGGPVESKSPWGSVPNFGGGAESALTVPATASAARTMFEDLLYAALGSFGLEILSIDVMGFTVGGDTGLMRAFFGTVDSAKTFMGSDIREFIRGFSALFIIAMTISQWFRISCWGLGLRDSVNNQSPVDVPAILEGRT